jgi:hypothetical protein
VLKDVHLHIIQVKTRGVTMDPHARVAALAPYRIPRDISCSGVTGLRFTNMIMSSA